MTGGGIEGTRAWNSARGASTVDGDLIPPQFWGAKSLVDQASECMDTVGSGEAWMLSRKGVGSATEAGEMEGDMSERSIFIFWFGINDVANTAEDHGADELEILYEKVVESYVGVLERLYEHGGRWFVVLGVPRMSPSLIVSEDFALEVGR